MLLEDSSWEDCLGLNMVMKLPLGTPSALVSQALTAAEYINY